MAAKKSEDKEILEGKVWALLSYLSILCIIPLVLKKDNLFVLWHGKQGLVIFMGQVVVFVMHIVLGPWILNLGFFILGSISLWGLIEVLRGNYVKLPIICGIADKITL